VRRLRAAIEAFAAIPAPTIAALHAVTAGGGCELALACDLRVLAAEASIGLPECGLAIIPGAGATQRLPRLVGPALAKKWILTARLFPAEEALEDGVVQAVVPREEVLEAALDLAGQIAACGPVAIRAAKRAMDGGLDAGTLEKGLELEWACYETIIPTEDRLEALEAFAAKRKPVYRGK
jgi:enoyl-CoA hydratase/carnithine racemase